jgi:hypothetical protein
LKQGKHQQHRINNTKLTPSQLNHPFQGPIPAAFAAFVFVALGA